MLPASIHNSKRRTEPFGATPNAGRNGRRIANQLGGLDERTVVLQLIQRKNRDLFLLSLRVLARIAEGISPKPEELSTLRANETPDEAVLPVDELCWMLIRRELAGRAVEEASE